jgi:hypothetical protein
MPWLLSYNRTQMMNKMNTQFTYAVQYNTLQIQICNAHKSQRKSNQRSGNVSYQYRSIRD